MSAAPSPWRVRGSLADRLEVVLPLVAYAVVVLSRATTSSLGYPTLRENGDWPTASIWGKPQFIRMDEYATYTPVELGYLAGARSASPLGEASDLFDRLPRSPSTSLLLLDSDLLRLGAWLPHDLLFAAHLALPVLLTLGCLPPLLRRLGADRPFSWLATALCLLAPSAAWWSFLPIRDVAAAACGGWLLLLGRDRWSEGARYRAVGAGVLGGVVLANLATGYPIWGLTIGLPVTAAVVLTMVVEREGRRAGVLVLGIGAVAGAMVLGAGMLSDLDAFRAQVGTVYPGSRRSSGGGLGVFQLFGAPGLVAAVPGPPTALNQSEISSAYTVTAVLAFALAPFAWRRMTGSERAAGGTLLVATGLLLAWAAVDWGPSGTLLPVLNLVPPARAAQTVGFVSTLAVGLVASKARGVSTPWRLFSALACAAITVWGVADLGNVLPRVGVTAVLTAGLVVGLIAFRLSSGRADPVSTAAAISGAALVVVFVNPVQFGLGDLRESAAAGMAQGLARTRATTGGLVVSDTPSLDALLTANGVPLLSGFQTAGPSRAAWAQLDPDGRYVNEWNRGVSRLQFSFRGAGDTVVSSPLPDSIRILTDPCRLVSSGLDVRQAVTSQTLTSACATLSGRFTWDGRVTYVYDLHPG